MISRLTLWTDETFRASIVVGEQWFRHGEIKTIEYCISDDDGPERFMIVPVKGRIFYIVASAVESFEPNQE